MSNNLIDKSKTNDLFAYMEEPREELTKKETKDDEVEVLSVSSLSNSIKCLLEKNFLQVMVKGEISGFKLHSSGHAYFSIKDDVSVIDCVCWRGTLSKINLTQPPRDGMKVILTGKVTTYAGRSKYQLVVSNIELSGKGALLALLQELKQKLTKEGLFDLARKKTLPRLPNKIGIVTSPTGAVIRDMLHRISDRMPSHIILYPVNVQGEGSADQVAKAISALDNKGNVDVIIVARGGGSIEDLWTFNEEVVVRAIASAKTPIISAIGHETDTTLADYAADYRAPTPSAAAEKVVPVRFDLLTYLDTAQNRLSTSINRLLQESQLRLESLSRGLPDAMSIIEERQQWIDERFERIEGALKRLIDISLLRLSNISSLFDSAASNQINSLQQRLENIASLFESYSYKDVLRRGFAILRDKDGNIIKSKKKVRPEQPLRVTLSDGEFNAKPIE